MSDDDLTVRRPLVQPFGGEITSAGLQEAWRSICPDLKIPSIEERIVFGAINSVYCALEKEERAAAERKKSTGHDEGYNKIDDELSQLLSFATNLPPGQENLIVIIGPVVKALGALNAQLEELRKHTASLNVINRIG